jgi:AraC-like DNA-binding protein
MSRAAFVLTFSAGSRIYSGVPGRSSLRGSAELKRIASPQDYFGQTRTSPNLDLRNILCFTRQSRNETAAQPLSRHHHHRYVLVVPWEGTGAAYADDRRFSLRPGEALLIFPFQFHHGFSFNERRVLWLFITFEAGHAAPLEHLRMHPLRKPRADDIALLAEFAKAWLRTERKDELSLWLGLFLSRLMRSAVAGGIEPRSGTEPANASSLLARINRKCLPALDHAPGLKQLAIDLGISESYLRARFRRETGISLGQHLRRLRLQKAMGLLLQSELSITVIADRCGFDSVYSFSRSFRHFTGMPAREYRKRFGGS